MHVHGQCMAAWLLKWLWLCQPITVCVVGCADGVKPTTTMVSHHPVGVPKQARMGSAVSGLCDFTACCWWGGVVSLGNLLC